YETFGSLVKPWFSSVEFPVKYRHQTICWRTDLGQGNCSFSSIKTPSSASERACWTKPGEVYTILKETSGAI
ncbi:hypothetical protein, partial [Fulvivirga kasyanovii]|uniref:hypothetical protein n=1 Tax=Fulvivirga kasyanovii TaxID=396812 RepID=UPI001C886796